jgi:hypothetical protein
VGKIRRPQLGIIGRPLTRCGPALAAQLAPDLVGAVDLQVLVEHALHLGQQQGIALGPLRQQRGIALTRCVLAVRRRGDLQRTADRLDPATSAVLVDEGVHLL